jgi:cytochrome b6-f complex iron-sulfur subunit
MGSLIRTMGGVLGTQVLARVTRSHHEVEHTPRKVGRRSFVRNAALGSVVLNLGLLSAGTIRLLYPNKTGDFGKTLTVPKAAIPAVGGQPFVNSAGKFYLIHTQDGVMALYWKCVHLGCTVPPYNMAAMEFHCPCHGSIYNYEGVRTGGPAPRPLDYMTCTVTDTGDIDVNTGEINQRQAYLPDQAVKI